LWAGRLERLALDELHSPLHHGGLGISCVATRAEALRVKLACHQLEARGQPQLHLAYWLGLTLRPQLPALGAGPHTEIVPPLFQSLGRSLLEAFGLDCVEVGALGAVTSARLYKELTATLPPPKIEFKLPGLQWRHVWSGLATAGLPPPLLVDAGFSAIHNILPLQSRRQPP
jgi:hypothetical protein